jgi:phosphate transport system permease protein
MPGFRPASLQWSAKRLRVFNKGDAITRGVVTAAAAVIIILAAMIVYELWVNSALARERFGWEFLLSRQWNPVAGEFGALPFVYGTVVTSSLALLIAVPMGVAAAVFLAELAPPRLSDGLTFLIELLAAVPSVIYGLIGVLVGVPLLREYVHPVLVRTVGWSPFFEGPFYGVSLFAAGIILALMILPFIVSVSRQVLLAVPREQREGALALGATQWETTWRVVVPFAKTGILGSIFLALARALGETMAVAMVVGNQPQVNTSLLAPGYSIAAVIANEFREATTEMHLESLVYLGLVLFALTIAINGVARLLVASTTRASTRAA